MSQQVLEAEQHLGERLHLVKFAVEAANSYPLELESTPPHVASSSKVWPNTDAAHRRCSLPKTLLANVAKPPSIRVVLVVSQVPLPNYRADLDDRHGSSQRQISMSATTGTRVENMLANIRGADVSSSSTPEIPKDDKTIQPRSSWGQASSQGLTSSEVDKEKQNLELRENQRQLKASGAVKALEVFRRNLPAFNMKVELLEAVKYNQVLWSLERQVVERQLSCHNLCWRRRYRLAGALTATLSVLSLGEFRLCRWLLVLQRSGGMHWAKVWVTRSVWKRNDLHKRVSCFAPLVCYFDVLSRSPT